MMNPHRRESGVAIVVVLLLTVVVLSLIVATTSSMSLGSREGSGGERNSYAALLLAESGINTFPARVEALPRSQSFRGTATAEALNTWAAAQNINVLAFDATSAATLTFSATSDPTVFTLQSRAVTPTSVQVVAKDVTVQRPTQATMRVDAPLESYPNATITGNATVIGESALTSTGTTEMARTTSSVAVPAMNTGDLITVPVTASTYFDPGTYVTVGGVTYRVASTATGPDSLTLAAIRPSISALTLVSGLPVGRVDSALVTPVTVSIGQTTTLGTSDSGMYVPGSQVMLGSLVGTVRSTTAAPDTVTVQWTASSPAGTSQVTADEGTPIRRDVKGVVSGYGVSGTTSVVNGTSASDLRVRAMNPFDPNSNPDLFKFTFGQTKAEMLPPTGWLVPVGSGFDGNVSGVTFYDGTLGLQGSKSLCGNGILIVRGDLRVNGTCAAGFYGAVYVLGDYDQQGNSVINGAVITEGSTEIDPGTECVVIEPSTDPGKGGNNCDTKIAGTGAGGKIQFDRGALLKAGVALAPTRVPTVGGTWRQR